MPLPLGWMISTGIAKVMRDQLQLDDDVVQNDTAIKKMLKALPGPIIRHSGAMLVYDSDWHALTVRTLTMSM